jgi:hypothetical protein
VENGAEPVEDRVAEVGNVVAGLDPVVGFGTDVFMVDKEVLHDLSSGFLMGNRLDVLFDA